MQVLSAIASHCIRICISPIFCFGFESNRVSHRFNFLRADQQICNPWDAQSLQEQSMRNNKQTSEPRRTVFVRNTAIFNLNELTQCQPLKTKISKQRSVPRLWLIYIRGCEKLGTKAILVRYELSMSELISDRQEKTSHVKREWRKQIKTNFSIKNNLIGFVKLSRKHWKGPPPGLREGGGRGERKLGKAPESQLYYFSVRMFTAST